jgi:hypothetical protein
MNMFFIVLTALTALFVAGCSAFFSIKGLTVLFSGSAIAVGIMASSLELGKLVAASFLHNHWKNISRLLRLYLCVAVVVLMGITSLGIFGFLSNAYQEHAGALRSIDAKIEMVENGRKSTLETIELNTSRIKSLNEIRATQEQRIKDSGNLKAPREQAYKAISEANEELAKKEVALKEAKETLAGADETLTALKISANSSTDIGSFKFIANALHVDLDTAVQYFIFALIAVFDPLAVTLILALNRLLELRAEKKRDEDGDFLKAVLERPITGTSTDWNIHVAVPVTVAEPVPAQPAVIEEPPVEEVTEAQALESIEAAAVEQERRRRMSGANKSVITY